MTDNVEALAARIEGHEKLDDSRFDTVTTAVANMAQSLRDHAVISKAGTDSLAVSIEKMGTRLHERLDGVNLAIAKVDEKAQAISKETDVRMDKILWYVLSVAIGMVGWMAVQLYGSLANGGVTM